MIVRLARRLCRAAVARVAVGLLAIGLFAAGLLVAQPAAAVPLDAVPAVSLSVLPPQVADTLQLIAKGGPFPHARDGVPFGNHERRLPIEARDYYHEYTVPTPGARDRGARRIVAGRRGEHFYTDDHYSTFRRIIE
jgi:ribonuclease T1